MFYSGSKNPIPLYKQILANQELLEGGWLTISYQDMCDYEVAKAESPEAEQKFLAARQERNRQEAENPPPSPPPPPPEPTLPPLVLNETMEFLQEVAEDGILLALTKIKRELVGIGNRYQLEDWRPHIMEKLAAVRQTLIEINSTYGLTDPLGLVKRVEDFAFEKELSALESYQQRGMDDVHAILRYQKELKEDSSMEIFSDVPTDCENIAAPKDPDETLQPRCYKLRSVADVLATKASQYRVKRILPCEGVSAIYGPPGAGKTFVALDLAFAISDGMEWFGYRVKPCDVLYICLEGLGGLPQRIKAYCEHRGDAAGKRLEFITAPFSLFYQDDVGALIRTLPGAGALGGLS